TAAGAELVVTEELMQGALEHEHLEDLSDVVPDVDAAEPIVGPPSEDQTHIVYYDDVETEARR
ncbi:MAG: MFS transporter, partial [Halomonas venusta]|nr:MFS transporter [Halomonas venusta]